MHFDSLKLVQTVENGNPMVETAVFTAVRRDFFLSKKQVDPTVHPGSRDRGRRSKSSSRR